MKKLWLLSLFLVGLFLYWCWSGTTTTQSEIFENDLKCQDFLKDYSKSMMDYMEYSTNVYFSENPKIFYSPIENTCIVYEAIWNSWLNVYNIESTYGPEKSSSYVYWFLDNELRNHCYSNFKNIEFNEDCTLSREDAEQKRLDEINYLKWN